ncbi:MAG: hypothetical protein JWM99_1553 [Verrucomicrobiales bacterium]|nr:hypothetical protein [Verrucomicrobiales bacterium]
MYIETTIPSYLTAWPLSDLIRAGHQKITKDWWDQRRPEFALYISQFVLDEVSAGDVMAAATRLGALEGLPLLPVTSQTEALAASLIHDLNLPLKAALDAAHISIAACSNMDFLLTWNCRHINNAELSPQIRRTCRSLGLESPVICTPEELMGI